MQFSSFSSHPVNLICLSSWIFTGLDPGLIMNRLLRCAVWKYKVVFWRKTEKLLLFCFFFDCKAKQRKADIQKDTVAMDWMHFGFLNQLDLMGPRGPLLHVFFHWTKALRLLYWFLSISQRKIEWQKKGQKSRTWRILIFIRFGLFLFVFIRSKKEKRQTLLSTIDYYLLRRYLFMLSSPTNSRGSCEYIYS